MDVLADGVALRHRGDDRLAEVLRVRAREPDALDARRRRRTARSSSPNSVAISGRRSRPHELTFWPSSVISRTPSRARPRHLGEDLARAGGSPRGRARPGTMQYAHVELQPIETCTQAWKRALAVHRQLGRERALVGGAEPAARRRPRRPRRASRRDAGSCPARRRRRRTGRARRSARAAPRRSSRRRRRRSRVAPLQRGCVAQVRGEARSGFSRIVQVLKTTTSASSGAARLAEPELLEHALDPLGVVGVHLAAERGDEVAPHRASDGSPATTRAHGCGRSWRAVRIYVQPFNSAGPAQPLTGWAASYLAQLDGARLADDRHLDLPRVLELLLDLAGDLVGEQHGVSSSTSPGLTITRISRPAWSA